MKKQFCFLLFFVLPVFFPTYASEPAIWSVNTRAEILKGDATGVSITDTGAITLAPKLSEIFKTEQPYVWSSAIDAGGNVFLGTGSDGRIYRIDQNGKGAIFADTNELNVSALAIGKTANFLRERRRTEKFIGLLRTVHRKFSLSRRKNTSGLWQF